MYSRVIRIHLYTRTYCPLQHQHPLSHMHCVLSVASGRSSAGRVAHDGHAAWPGPRAGRLAGRMWVRFARHVRLADGRADAGGGGRRVGASHSWHNDLLVGGRHGPGGGARGLPPCRHERRRRAAAEPLLFVGPTLAGSIFSLDTALHSVTTNSRARSYDAHLVEAGDTTRRGESSRSRP